MNNPTSEQTKEQIAQASAYLEACGDLDIDYTNPEVQLLLHQGFFPGINSDEQPNHSPSF